MKWGPAFGLLLFALPSIAFAQVVIDEIMYDPSGSNAGRQWIELYNEGTADVTMVGGTVKGSWRVNDGSNHTLTDPSGGVGQGSLTIPAGGYLVVSSDPATFLSEYSGSYSVVKSSISLKTSGGAVSLVDGNGATVDSASYTSAMGGSDDGASLQEQPDGFWIEALPTPGAANATTPYAPPPDDSASQTDQSPDSASTTQSAQSKTQAQSSYIPPPAPSLYADAGGDRAVIAGADVEFDGEAYDKNQNLLDPTTVRFLWNFGDGTTAEGPAVLHHFVYPGRYAVVLTIGQNKNAVGDEAIVTAEPAALSFSLLPEGGVEIDDLAGHDLDLSQWIVREDGGTFAAQFILPDDSKILSGSSMKIAAGPLGFRASSSTLLEYPNGAPALLAGQTTASTTPVQPQAQQAAAAPEGAAAAPLSSPQAPTGPGPEPASAAPDDAAPEDDPDPLPAAAASTSTVVQTAAAAASKPDYLWWLGAVLLALSAGAGTIAAKHFKKREWDVVEETEN